MAKEKLKSEFCMLAKDFKPEKHGYLGWAMSEKLDGMRCIYDGGISRGMFCEDVPYANTAKHGRYRDRRVATGLWSRYGQPIYAPEWFLNHLPKQIPLDGELTMGRGMHQQTMSCCKDLEPSSSWEHVKYWVFEAPNYEQLLENRKINNTFFKKEFWSIPAWCVAQGVKLDRKILPFYATYGFLKNNITETDNLKILNQEFLPSGYDLAKEIVSTRLEQVSLEGGEGLILRNTVSLWKPERTDSLVKVKKLQDTEVEIIGFKWADLTDLDRSLTGEATNKLKGMIGSFKVKLLETGKVFDLGCGFTEQERRAVDSSGYVPGQDCSSEGVHFKRGDIITVKFREYSNDGIPKEARYFRRKVI